MRTLPPGNLRNDHQLLIRIKDSLKDGKSVVLFYFDIARFHEIEQSQGLEIAHYILELFNDTLAHGLRQLYKKSTQILAAESLWGDDFIIITETVECPTLSTLEYLATAYRKEIRESMSKEFLRLTGRNIDVHIGYAIIDDTSRNLQVQLYNATKQAFGIAKGFINMETVKYLAEFKDVLAQRRLYSVYQPIVCIRSADVLGWEALIRGPADSYFQNPDTIFAFAEARELLFPLEKYCCESALAHIGDLGPDQKIFINVHPRTMNDPSFSEVDIAKIIRDLRVAPQNIVIEITERHHIKDFSAFNKTLAFYRDQGFQMAVDDVGSGFSTLQSIAEIRPDFIKIDMSLVRGIHKDRVKAALMETFVTFAEKIGSEIIAEGIEEEGELALLSHIGVHYGQGYFFGRPVCPRQTVSEEIRLKTLQLQNKRRFQLIKNAFPVSDIVDEAICVSKQTPVKSVKDIFDNDISLSGVVIAEEGKPVGLMMRHHLDHHLGRKFGIELYYEKPVSRIMDQLPLVVDESTSIELVSQVAMNRAKINLYDNIIATSTGQVRGIISVQTLLDAMTRIRLELAKGANPLTGLPGNIAIEQEYYRLVKTGKPFNIIFIDLDHFKSYNDKYGFEKGDAVILFTADLLRQGLKQHGEQDGFLGHIGGDDFIVFTTEDAVDSLCAFIIKHFDAGVVDLYTPDDRKAGGIFAHDRSGREQWFTFISISMAVMDCTAETGQDMKEVSGKVAQLKQYAKSQPGSVYVRDRRSS